MRDSNVHLLRRVLHGPNEPARLARDIKNSVVIALRRAARSELLESVVGRRRVLRRRFLHESRRGEDHCAGFLRGAAFKRTAARNFLWCARFVFCVLGFLLPEKLGDGRRRIFPFFRGPFFAKFSCLRFEKISRGETKSPFTPRSLLFGSQFVETSNLRDLRVRLERAIHVFTCGGRAIKASKHLFGFSATRMGINIAG